MTSTSTIWGNEKTPKYSIRGSSLRPDTVFLDPALCLSAPREVKTIAGLDAMSHAFEAVWNRRSNSCSDIWAYKALSIIRCSFERSLKKNSAEADLADMQMAAYYAGRAIDQTGTALAHSLSYPITAYCEIPHGVACSFTLAKLAERCISEFPDRLSVAALAWDCPLDQLSNEILLLLKRVGIYRHMNALARPNAIARCAPHFLDGRRSLNSLLLVNLDEAVSVVESACSSMME